MLAIVISSGASSGAAPSPGTIARTTRPTGPDGGHHRGRARLRYRPPQAASGGDGGQPPEAAGAVPAPGPPRSTLSCSRSSRLRAAGAERRRPRCRDRDPVADQQSRVPVAGRRARARPGEDERPLPAARPHGSRGPTPKSIRATSSCRRNAIDPAGVPGTPRRGRRLSGVAPALVPRPARALERDRNDRDRPPLDAYLLRTGTPDARRPASWPTRGYAGSQPSTRIIRSSSRKPTHGAVQTARSLDSNSRTAATAHRVFRQAAPGRLPTFFANLAAGEGPAGIVACQHLADDEASTLAVSWARDVPRPS